MARGNVLAVELSVTFSVMRRAEHCPAIYRNGMTDRLRTTHLGQTKKGLNRPQALRIERARHEFGQSDICLE